MSVLALAKSTNLAFLHKDYTSRVFPHHRPTTRLLFIPPIFLLSACAVAQQYSIHAGKAADIVVLRGDLTKDATAFQQIALVVRAGRVVFDAAQKWTACVIDGSTPTPNPTK